MKSTAKCNRPLFERDVNRKLSKLLAKDGLYVLSEVRLNPYELDVVALDPVSLRLVNFEIKRRDWRKLLNQSCRAQLYCDFAVAVLPARLEASVSINEFEVPGVGLFFYRWTGRQLEMTARLQPRQASRPSRILKRALYARFADRYGASLRAAL